MDNHVNFILVLLTAEIVLAPAQEYENSITRVLKPFEIYWNVPTYLCKKKHYVDFEPMLREYGIHYNVGDEFRGEKIMILYEPGEWPMFIKNKTTGKLSELNGGIPQEGDLQLHLDEFRKVLENERVMPKDFSGIGIIDFEVWRPVFRQHWNDQVIYKKMSKNLVRQKHPLWREKHIEASAKSEFEYAARKFMENTLKLAKQLSPKAKWGYYGFPYCLNYGKQGYRDCPSVVMRENDDHPLPLMMPAAIKLAKRLEKRFTSRGVMPTKKLSSDEIKWLFEASQALYPSLYSNYELTGNDLTQFVRGRLNEALRMARQVSSSDPPDVYPYIWYRYNDRKEFLENEDIYNILEETRKYNTGGAIIWGSSKDLKSRENCEDLLYYLDTVLGPAIRKIKVNNSEIKNLGFILSYEA